MLTILEYCPQLFFFFYNSFIQKENVKKQRRYLMIISQTDTKITQTFLEITSRTSCLLCLAVCQNSQYDCKVLSGVAVSPQLCAHKHSQEGKNKRGVGHLSLSVEFYAFVEGSSNLKLTFLLILMGIQNFLTKTFHTSFILQFCGGGQGSICMHMCVRIYMCEGRGQCHFPYSFFEIGSLPSLELTHLTRLAGSSQQTSETLLGTGITNVCQAFQMVSGIPNKYACLCNEYCAN